MSAIEEIAARLAQLRNPPRGAMRVILVGISAERSMLCTLDSQGRRLEGLPEKFNGIDVMPTNEFEGWTIRDCLASGRWVEAEPIVRDERSRQ